MPADSSKLKQKYVINGRISTMKLLLVTSVSLLFIFILFFYET